jgi:hypothetical protein
MKNIIRKLGYLSVFVAWFLLGACTKLEDTSYTDIIASDFVPTNEDVGALLGDAYGKWRNVLWGGGRAFFTVQEETADELVRARKPYGFYDGGIHQLLHLHTWTSEDRAFGRIWDEANRGITACNRIIFQIESGQIPLEGPDKDVVLAEIKVLRASYYWALLDIFGNVPIVTDFDVEPGYLPEQNTRLEVYNFVVNEIVQAIPLLSEDHSVETYGRFNNKWAAYALLARVYLNAEVYSGTAHWEDCISACNAIIDSGKGFALESVQKNAFKEQNQNSPELVWAVPFDEVFDGIWFPLNVLALPHQSSQTYNLRSTGWGGLTSIPQFIDTYKSEDKRLTDGWLQGQIYSSSGEALRVNTGNMKGELMIVVNVLPGIDSSEEVHSFRPLKYEVPIGSNPANMSNDVPMIRYADVLMMKAECLMRLGRPGAGALVTEVRLRNFPDNPAEATVTDAELEETSSYDYGLRDYILGVTHETEPIMYGRFLDELAWEFAVEGRRRMDMIRFNVFTTRSRLSFQEKGETFRRLGAIPLWALNTNPNLKQNPGY